MKNIYYLLLLTSIFITGCATKLSSLQTTFNANEAKDMLVKGNNSITGSALIRMKNGGVVTCAGGAVELVPLTNYSKERIIAIYGNDQEGYSPTGYGSEVIKFSNEPEDYKKLVKKTHCDAQGYFNFKDIADGSFFLVTHIGWLGGYFDTKQGGSLMHRVDLSNGENKNIVLSP